MIMEYVLLKIREINVINLNSGFEFWVSRDKLVRIMNKDKYGNLLEIEKEFKKALKSLLNDKIYPKISYD